MSETTTEPTTTEPETGETEPAQVKDWQAEATKWQELSKKNEARARENKGAADKLAAIEEANKTEVQKSADRLAAAEKDVADARNESLRYRIAAEFKLTEKQAAALAHVSSEDGMRDVAEQLAASESDRKKHGNFVPREGNNAQAGDDPMRAMARDLFQTAD